MDTFIAVIILSFYYESLFFYSACQNAMTTGWVFLQTETSSQETEDPKNQTWMAAIGMQRSQKPQIVFSLDEQLKAT